MPVMPKLQEALCSIPETLLIGVSGGIDSVALLHALLAIGRRPVVLHFDHGWRADSRADAEWVKNLADKFDLKFVSARAPKTKTQREAKARQDRYAFFTKTAHRLKIADLVLAHQADDQVETFLLQLLRGSGAAARGMDAMAERAGLKLHRPWLSLWRQDIQAYARQHRLQWREDTSNLDLRHRRNLIRRQVLPYLRRKFSPQIADNLWRGAEIARAESAWLDSLCAATTSTTQLDVKFLRASCLGQQRRSILRWLQARGVEDLGFADVEAVRRLVEKLSPARINLSAGKFARRRAGKIFIE